MVDSILKYYRIFLQFSEAEGVLVDLGCPIKIWVPELDPHYNEPNT
jgi:hypothetical protein